jgi:hypothetical protein
MKLLVRRHVATVSYRLDSYGMQEVRGSNPRSSTSQLRVIDSNSRCEAAFLFRANVRDVAILGESAKGQINGGATALGSCSETSCIAGKRSSNGRHVDAAQRRLSNSMTAGSSRGSKTDSRARAAELAHPETPRPPAHPMGTCAADGQPAEARSQHAASACKIPGAQPICPAVARELRRDADGRSG